MLLYYLNCNFHIFLEIPIIISPVTSQGFTTNEGTDITFNCTATGFPSPSISFLLQDQILTRTDGRPMDTTGLPLMDRVSLSSESTYLNTSTGIYEVTRSLTLFDPTERDSATFMCNASTDIPVFGERSASVSFNLLVYRKFV